MVGGVSHQIDEEGMEEEGMEEGMEEGIEVDHLIIWPGEEGVVSS